MVFKLKVALYKLLETSLLQQTRSKYILFIVTSLASFAIKAVFFFLLSVYIAGIIAPHWAVTGG